MKEQKPNKYKLSFSIEGDTENLESLISDTLRNLTIAVRNYAELKLAGTQAYAVPQKENGENDLFAEDDEDDEDEGDSEIDEFDSEEEDFAVDSEDEEETSASGTDTLSLPQFTPEEKATLREIFDELLGADSSEWLEVMQLRLADKATAHLFSLAAMWPVSRLLLQLGLSELAAKQIEDWARSEPFVQPWFNLSGFSHSTPLDFAEADETAPESAADDLRQRRLKIGEEKFTDFVRQWVIGWQRTPSETPLPQPDRVQLMQRLGSGLGVHETLEWIRSVGYLQVAVKVALKNAGVIAVDGEDATSPEICDLLAANMVQVSHMGFPHLAGSDIYSYGSAWKNHFNNY